LEIKLIHMKWKKENNYAATLQKHEIKFDLWIWLDIRCLQSTPAQTKYANLNNIDILWVTFIHFFYNIRRISIIKPI
jgi:hypothetical protein